MITKTYSPKGKSCRVTFELPATVAEENISVVGDFNNWDARTNKMAFQKKNEIWKSTIALKPGNTYEFRYYSDKGWMNDDEADGYKAQNGLLEV